MSRQLHRSHTNESPDSLLSGIIELANLIKAQSHYAELNKGKLETIVEELALVYDDIRTI
jgi:hypothetical protein